MMRRLARLGVALCMIFVFAAPAHVGAQTDVIGDPCSDPAVAAKSPTCLSRTKENPITGPDGTLDRISTVVAIIAGISAVIMIILSGFRYVTSGGDTQKIASAKNTLIGAIVGLVIIVVARGIIVLVLKSIG